MTGPAGRERALEELRRGTFDLLVIGAGIVGSRVAYEASAAGLRVALVDSGDIGGATSSSSSKLIHGGLRYLATGDFSLVRRSQQERRILAARVAPRLVRPLPVLLVVAPGQRAARSRLALALSLYAAVTGFRSPRPGFASRKDAATLVSGLDPGSLAAVGLVPEAQTHDARLTLETAKGAAAHGAVVANYVRVCALEQARGRIVGAVLEDALGTGAFALRCRAAVNAAGPWVDAIRLLEAPQSPPITRLSKGVQVLLPLVGRWRAGVALFDESRTAFVAPWQGMLLVGATDTPYCGDASAAVATPADVAALLDPFAALLSGAALSPSRVRYAFVGLRVLPRGTGDTALAPRRHAISVGPAGLISIAGGKLTTHRLVASDALRRLPRELRPTRSGPTDEPLAGAPARTVAADLRRRLDPEVVNHLVYLYGAEAGRLLSYERVAAHALERIHPNGPDIWAQAYFAFDHEWAVTVEDVVARRTTVAVRGLGREDAAVPRQPPAGLLASDQRPVIGDALLEEPRRLFETTVEFLRVRASSLPLLLHRPPGDGGYHVTRGECRRARRR
jgi:glycerol-3-phosphate dehydrogenase